MRPDPKQLAIVKALTAHLEGINPTVLDPADDAAGNYDLDLRDKVKRGRIVFGAETPVPFLAILERPNPNPTVGVGYAKTKRKEEWDLLLQGFAADDKENPLDPAYALKGVVEMRLARLVAVDVQADRPIYPDEYMLGNLIFGLTIGQGVVRPPEVNVSSRAYFYLPLCLEITTDVNNPFSVAN